MAEKFKKIRKIKQTELPPPSSKGRTVDELRLQQQLKEADIFRNTLESAVKKHATTMLSVDDLMPVELLHAESFQFIGKKYNGHNFYEKHLAIGDLVYYDHPAKGYHNRPCRIRKKRFGIASWLFDTKGYLYVSSGIFSKKIILTKNVFDRLEHRVKLQFTSL